MRVSQIFSHTICHALNFDLALTPRWPSLFPKTTSCIKKQDTWAILTFPPDPFSGQHVNKAANLEPDGVNVGEEGVHRLHHRHPQLQQRGGKGGELEEDQGGVSPEEEFIFSRSFEETGRDEKRAGWRAWKEEGEKEMARRQEGGGGGVKRTEGSSWGAKNSAARFQLAYNPRTWGKVEICQGAPDKAAANFHFKFTLFEPSFRNISRPCVEKISTFIGCCTVQGKNKSYKGAAKVEGKEEGYLVGWIPKWCPIFQLVKYTLMFQKYCNKFTKSLNWMSAIWTLILAKLSVCFINTDNRELIIVDYWWVTG